jgi:tetraprenyl-beta-curcumene synthase
VDADVSAVGDRWFVARAGLALAVAHARYWSRVAPLVRRELRRWEDRAAEIADPTLRRFALEKLADERFNAEVAAVIATVAPARHRACTVQAIVALQVMYDYLDALTEQPTDNPIRDGHQLTKAFTDAVTLSAKPTGDYYAFYPGPGDGDYLSDLARVVRAALSCLPAIDAIAQIVPISAARCMEAQVRIHAAPRSGIAQLESWATHGARDTELQWREYLFGAMGSVLAIHALIAAAGDERTTRAQADELDSVYLSLCVLTTALDHLVDHDHDLLTGEESYLDLYASRECFAQRTAAVAARVMDRARTIPNSPHHAMILAGVVAYYTSQPSAMGELARPATEQVRDELRPLITPTLATVRAWRLAKRLRSIFIRARRARAAAPRAGREQSCARSRDSGPGS